MGMKKLLLLFLLSSTCATYIHSEVYTEFGISVEHPSKSDRTDSKNIEFGYTDSIKRFEYRMGVGGWTDETRYRDLVLGSLYVQTSIGIEIQPHGVPIIVSYFVGPAYIARTDVILGSNLQIYQSIGVFLDGRDNKRIGVAVKHFSNGGLKRPNTGRNFVVLQIQF